MRLLLSSGILGSPPNLLPSCVLCFFFLFLLPLFIWIFLLYYPSLGTNSGVTTSPLTVLHYTSPKNWLYISLFSKTTKLFRPYHIESIYISTSQTTLEDLERQGVHPPSFHVWQTLGEPYIHSFE